MSFDTDALAAYVAKHDPAQQGPAVPTSYDRETFEALMKAATRFDVRTDGFAVGSCGCCGRELTDPESIRQGIGPICADKFGGGF